MGTDQHVVLSDGLCVSYAEAGVADGAVVLYLHGTPGSRMQITGPLSAVAAQLGLRLVAPDRPDRPGYGDSSFVQYRVVDYTAMIARFADSLGIGRFSVVGTSGGGRYAYACGVALADRVRRVALVGSTAPPDLLGVRQTWSKSDRRLYTRGGQSAVASAGHDGKDRPQPETTSGTDAEHASGHVGSRPARGGARGHSGAHSGDDRRSVPPRWTRIRTRRATGSTAVGLQPGCHRNAGGPLARSRRHNRSM